MADLHKTKVRDNCYEYNKFLFKTQILLMELTCKETNAPQHEKTLILAGVFSISSTYEKEATNLFFFSQIFLDKHSKKGYTSIQLDLF